MKLKEELFRQPKVEMYAIDFSKSGENYLNWEIKVIDAPILTSEYVKEYVYDKRLQGDFLVKGKIIYSLETHLDCFISVGLPSRIWECCFYQKGGEIIMKTIEEVGVEVISTVAIEGYNNHNLFYSKIAPNVGINALTYAVKISNNKSLVGLDLAYILRDEGRFQESIDIFSLLIEHNKFFDYFLERAFLYEKIGNHTLAQQDWLFIKKCWGKKILNHYKPNLNV